MEVFDNVNKIVKNDPEITIANGSKLSAAAACFSIYAYQALKKRLDKIKEPRFIFTSPAFVSEKAPYNKLDAVYDSSIFTEPTLKGQLGVNAMAANKHLYDHILYDSTNECRS
jgi:hypothetical protein